MPVLLCHAALCLRLCFTRRVFVCCACVRACVCGWAWFCACASRRVACDIRKTKSSRQNAVRQLDVLGSLEEAQEAVRVSNKELGGAFAARGEGPDGQLVGEWTVGQCVECFFF